MSRLIYVLLLLAGYSRLYAEETRLSRPLSALISDLTNDSFAIRAAACQALEAYGVAAIPALEQAGSSPDPEVRLRALSLLKRLHLHREFQEVLEPMRLRLAYRDVPLGFALEDFSRRTGYSLTLDPEASKDLLERPLTLDTGLVPFWEALEKFLITANLREIQAPVVLARTAKFGSRQFWIDPESLSGQFPQQNPGLILTGGPSAAQATTMVGGLRFRILPAHALPLVHRGPLGDSEIVLPLELSCDPQLRWHAVQTLRIDQARDERGQQAIQRDLYLATDPGELPLWRSRLALSALPVPSSGGGGGEVVPLRLTWGKSPGRRIVEIRGVVTCRLQTRPETLATLDQVMRRAGTRVRARDGTSLQLLEASRDDDGLIRLQVQVEPPAPENEDVAQAWGWGLRRWGWVQQVGTQGVGALSLLDANGHLIRQGPAENTDDGTGGAMGLRLTFRPAPDQAEPARLVLEGRRTVVLEVPFVLRDILIP